MARLQRLDAYQRKATRRRRSTACSSNEGRLLIKQKGPMTTEESTRRHEIDYTKLWKHRLEDPLFYEFIERLIALKVDNYASSYEQEPLAHDLIHTDRFDSCYKSLPLGMMLERATSEDGRIQCREMLCYELGLLITRSGGKYEELPQLLLRSTAVEDAELFGLPDLEYNAVSKEEHEMDLEGNLDGTGAIRDCDEVEDRMMLDD
ncbi:hypothetical protein BJ508DRAFT_301381 [Ascobolus immersus RN42]|uniref:Uncharacterized protein n=1 Tax=Ascobolus immersus RN42 TaxID=1160509 RepID=A0A3N4INH9_ASCIM|nr:hypothetical protein BJ508DRAFT_301381 [Ascobolus immersus RN42]